ncbi:gypsy retrotransposon integrase-like protein 1 [Pantherophis guttatus]|uniref:Gypsy retrotransposon integrase-like protein 1 n=1 Tax=Pantherophis guttatus TaxID=94885 RepID=A0ABM3ZEH5_PANGU|nr:gypsy retrotransposon integrase-like protein 1 [Pantherophis guttatus]
MSTFLPAFSPFVPASETWDTYMERFECFLQANALTELSSARKRGYFLSSCGSEIFAAARALAAPQQVFDIPWETLVERLKNHFSPTLSHIARRHAFWQCSQTKGESVNDYMASLRSAALHCEFRDHLDEMLLDQLVCGIKDLKLQRRLLARSELTLQVALDEARAAEMSGRSAAEIHRYQTPSLANPKPLSVHYEDSDQGESSDEEREVSRLKATQRKRGGSTKLFKFAQDTCLGCGGNHRRTDCRFKTIVCRRCGKRGHLSRVCRAPAPMSDVTSGPPLERRRGRKVPARREDCLAVTRYEDPSDIAVSNATPSASANKLFLTVGLEGSACTMEVDTGSSKSLIAWATLSKLLPGLSRRRLKPCPVLLKDYQGKAIPTLGYDNFMVSFRSFSGKLPLIVVRDARPTLLGLDWFAALNLSISGVHRVVPDVPSILAREFADVFSDQLGKYTGRPISFNLDPQVMPVRLKPRRVPLALRPRVDAELDKLVAQGILVPVDHSAWETPIVIPLKQDSSIRICTDYKCSINRALQANPYPVPVVQHLLHSLVDEPTAMAQTIVTHRGAFKCTRLQFGVSVAPGIFQSIMERLLQGIPGVVPYFDDVLVSAGDQADLLNKLRNHKPLLGLLAGDRQTPVMISPRMSRWVEFLAGYSYHLIYRPGSAIAHADALSRCPVPTPASDLAPASSVLLVEDFDFPLTASDISAGSLADPAISKVLDWVRRGWPKGPAPADLLPFFQRQNELSTQRGCLLWGNRVVVPEGLRCPVLAHLHNAHPGIVRMKGLGRSYVWWPGMDGDIEQWVATCPQCQASRPVSPAAPSREWEVPRAPWARIHMDFAGPFQGHTFLVVVDAYSKCVELALMHSTTTEAVIRVLEGLFATHGLPDTIVSDNGPQFTLAQFQRFVAKLGIRHTTMVPFHPAANGWAERAVRSAKEALSRLRRLRTVLDRLHPAYTPEITKGFTPHCWAFTIGDPVYAQNFGTDNKWVPGHICQLTGPYSYRVQLEDGRIWRRHVNQLRRRMPLTTDLPCKQATSAGDERPPRITSNTPSPTSPAIGLQPDAFSLVHSPA